MNDNPLIVESYRNMSTPITPLYAGVLGLMLAGLGIRAIMLGREHSTDVGDASHLKHEKSMQAFGNFTEYVPLALLLIWFLEQRSESRLSTHLFCLVFIAGRLLHAFGVSQVHEKYEFRMAGMGLTFFILIAASMRILLG